MFSHAAAPPAACPARGHRLPLKRVSVCPRVRVGRMNCDWADQLVPGEHLDGAYADTRIPGAAAAEVVIQRIKARWGPSREVGVGNPAEVNEHHRA